MLKEGRHHDRRGAWVPAQGRDDDSFRFEFQQRMCVRILASER